METKYPYLDSNFAEAKAAWLADPARLYLDAEDYEHYVEYFKEFHRKPELSWEESETRERIKTILSPLAELELLFAEDYGLLFRLRGSNKEGRTKAKYLFRADIDALPILEESGLDYASERPGLMHACGHDGHITILLALIENLYQRRAELSSELEFYFIFQAAEENLPSGAKTMLEAGLLGSYGPFTAVFGYHLVPQLAAGSIGLLPAGPATTANGFFTIEIEGKSSHSSQPQLGIDPILIAAELISGANAIVAKEFDPRVYKVLAICQVHGGSAQNQSPQRCELGGSIRVLDRADEKELIDRLERLCQSLALRHGASVKLNYAQGHPAIDNSAELRAEFKDYLRTRLSKERYFDLDFWSASEDFAYYRELAPVYYFHIGSAGDQRTAQFSNHHPCFTIATEALVFAADLLIGFALRIGA